MIIEVVSVSDDSEEEQEDVETPDLKRRNRWRRVAQAATKQSLRCWRALHAVAHPDAYRPPAWAPRWVLLAGCCDNSTDTIHSLAAALSTMQI